MLDVVEPITGLAPLSPSSLNLYACLTPPCFSFNAASALARAPDNSGTLFAAYQVRLDPTTQLNLARSNDNGLTWASVSGFSPVPLPIPYTTLSLAFSSGGTAVYLLGASSSALDLWRSSDSGASWRLDTPVTGSSTLQGVFLTNGFGSANALLCWKRVGDAVAHPTRTSVSPPA